MIQYTIQPKQQNFRPLEPILPFFNKKKFEVTFMFKENCYYSKEYWEGDGDWSDWNKLKGVSNLFTPNNVQAAMYAWRPAGTPDYIEVAPYVNDRNGDWIEGPGKLVRTETIRTFYIEWKDKNTVAFFYDGKYCEIELRRPWAMREIGTWIGGKNNAAGPYGGAATQRMDLFTNFKKY